MSQPMTIGAKPNRGRMLFKDALHVTVHLHINCCLLRPVAGMDRRGSCFDDLLFTNRANIAPEGTQVPKLQNR